MFYDVPHFITPLGELVRASLAGIRRLCEWQGVLRPYESVAKILSELHPVYTGHAQFRHVIGTRSEPALSKPKARGAMMVFALPVERRNAFLT